MIRPFHGRALLPQDRIDQIRYRRCNACQNRRHWCCRGAVAVEAALILPALLMIAAVATGSWRISEVKADAQSAAQVAARAGSVASSVGEGIAVGSALVWLSWLAPGAVTPQLLWIHLTLRFLSGSLAPHQHE